MEGSEDVAFVFRRKLVASVETQIKRGRVRRYEHIRNNDFGSELRMFSFVSRIGMVANIKPWPTIEAAGPHTADVVGWQILADFVPLVSAHPELIGARTKCDANGVTNSPGINLLAGAIGIKLEDARAIFFCGLVGHIRA